MYRIGAAKFTGKTLKVGKRFKWADTDINLLGICIDNKDFANSYVKILNKIEGIIRLWRQRNLTLKGKVILANSLIGSLLVYPMQILPTLNKNLTKRITKMLQEFIWNGRKPKIRMNTLQAAIDDGGLALFDAENRDKSLKVAWIKRLINMKPGMKALAYYCISQHIQNDDFWLYNINKKDLKYICNTDNFWFCVVTAFAEINFHDIHNINELMRERIWYNSHIKVGNEMFIIKKLEEKGCLEFQDIIDAETGTFYTHSKIQNEYDVSINYLNYILFNRCNSKKMEENFVYGTDIIGKRSYI